MSYILVVLVPCLLLGIGTSLWVHAAVRKWSKVKTVKGLRGCEAAQVILDRGGVSGVKICRTKGHLTDHYDPRTRTLRLSDKIYDSTSVAAVGIAAHEAGHAIQHDQAYAALGLRTALVPLAGIGSSIGYIVMLLGLLFHPYLILLGCALFSLVLLFQIVTLPVEFNASARAKKLALEVGLVTEQEVDGVSDVLRAAAMTYVAAVITTGLTLAWYLFRAFSGD